MHTSLKLFVTALVISFLGSIPLGTANVAVTHLAVRDGMQAALLFATGAVLIEMTYVRIAMIAMTWITHRHYLFRIFEWFTLGLILAIALGSFWAAMHRIGIGGLLPTPIEHPFLLGMLISATNPLHITFWFGWSSILLERGILLPENPYYNIYVCAIGIGSMLGYAFFIVGGTFLIHQLNANQNLLNWIVGVILLITFFIQLYKLLNHQTVMRWHNAKAIPDAEHKKLRLQKT